MNTQTPLYLSDKLIPACEIYIVVNNEEVLMFRRSPTSKNFPNFLLGPGGHIDVNEDPLTAVIRETLEETGVVLKPEQVKLKVLTFHHHLDRKEIFVEYLFRADITEKPELIHDIEGTSEWVTISDLANNDMIFPPLKPDLAHILDKNSGIKYSSSQWTNLQLVKETTTAFQIEK